MSAFRNYCDACDLRRQCEHTFGRFYADKSSGAVGCNHKIHPLDLARITECAAVVRPADVLTKTFAEQPKRNTNPSKIDILERLKRMRRS